MSRKKYWVVPSSGNWDVKHEGSVLSSHYLKEAAVTAGTKVARANEPSQLIIMRMDGTIEKEYTYGDDPYPPAG